MDEEKFQSEIRETEWFKEFTKEYGEEPNLDDPDYDYRAAWAAGVRPERYEHDGGKFHWPSNTPDGKPLKSENHPTKWMEDFMQKTGRDPNELGIKSKEEGEKYLNSEPFIDKITRPLPTNIRAYIRGMTGERSPIDETYFREGEIEALRSATIRGMIEFQKPLKPPGPKQNWDMNKTITREMFEEQQAHDEKYPDDEYRNYTNEHINYLHYDDPWIMNRPESILGWIKSPSRIAQTTVGAARIEHQENGDVVLVDHYDFDGGRGAIGTDLWGKLHRAGEKKLPEGQGYDIRINLGNPNRNWLKAGEGVKGASPESLGLTVRKGSSTDWNSPPAASIFAAIRRLFPSEQKPTRIETIHPRESARLDEPKFYSQLAKHEGFSEKVYKDSEGFDTIGYGHKVKPGEDWSKGITKEEAKLLLQQDAAEAIGYARTLPYWEQLNDMQQNVVAEMIFNLGFEGFKKFKKTNKLLEQGKFDEASKEMLNSKWAKQVKGRAITLANQMKE